MKKLPNIDYNLLKKATLNKKADGEGVTSYYEVTSPSGENISVSSGELAMSGGWVEDSKGKKFKPTKFKAKSISNIMGFK